MGVLRVNGLSKAFGIDELFSDVSFELSRGEKVGLIGGNGTGKTTLFRCLLGLEEIDSGEAAMPAGETVGYVEQDASFTKETLYEELCSAYQDVLARQSDMRRLEKLIEKTGHTEQAELIKEYAKAVEAFERGGGYEYESVVRRVAFGLGFTDEDFPRPVTTFSGGQKTRICLARALIRQPDFLFLDEPTNHLDIGMVEWLEEFLLSYAGGVLIISHDRYFLDKVTTKILELENNTLTVYRANYTGYLQQKSERVAALTSAYEKQQAYIAKTEAYIDRFRAGIKSKQARGRQSQLNRLERIVLPASEARFDYFAFNPPGECAERVAELIEAAAAYGNKVIFEKLSLLIRRGDGVALVGANGAGKTTLLKLLTGDLAPAAGRVKLGSRVKLGYFSQEHEGLNNKYRVIDELMIDYGLGEERARHYLGAFLFSGDDVFKSVSDLSGGEKARLALLKLMLTGANFLILDEPTNHLDIPAKEAIEEAIAAFPGTFLTVSHDRYFLDKVANCVVELEDGCLIEYMGNYSYYREKKAAVKSVAEKPPESKRVEPKAERVRTRTQANTRQREKLEEKIAELEVQIKVLEMELNNPANHTDAENSKALVAEYESTKQQLAEKYDEWAALEEE
jgi:ATP-binding cassette subfamily F protein 3